MFAEPDHAHESVIDKLLHRLPSAPQRLEGVVVLGVYGMMQEKQIEVFQPDATERLADRVRERIPGVDLGADHHALAALRQQTPPELG